MSIKVFFCKNTLFFLLCSLPFSVNAQNFYLKIGAAYAGASTASNIGILTNPMEDESFFAKYGSGLNSSLSVGYDFNDHFSLGLNTTYFGNYKMSDVFINGSEVVEYDILVKSYMQLSPILRLSSKRKKTYVYGEAGLVLPFFNGTEIGRNVIVFEEATNDVALEVEQKAAIKHQAKIGYTSTVGVSYVLSKKTAVFVEVIQTELNTYPERSSITTWHENEIDVLSTKNQIDTEIIFVDRLTKESNRAEPNLPLSTIRPATSFGQLNCRFGWEVIF